MNVVDEASSAHLQAKVYGCRKVSELDLGETTRGLNLCFERWGLPRNIKIDNGLPFVLPKQLSVPTLAKLWWVGLGINVIQNRVSCPQQNGAVEGSQGVMSKWSNSSGCQSVEGLQKRLDDESDFQRNHYHMPNRAGFTRIELYPELEQNPRVYNPANFDMQKVYHFLSRQVWQRVVKNSGEVRLFSSFIYIGQRYAKEKVTVTLDPIERKWIFRLGCGTYVKASEKGVPTSQEILEFALGDLMDTT